MRLFWAQYATQIMLDEGFLNNSPELRLTFHKEELRVLANAILDIRLQSLGMTDQQALDLMEKETFQKHEEATAKLRRAKLSSCQLPTIWWDGETGSASASTTSKPTAAPTDCRNSTSSHFGKARRPVARPRPVVDREAPVTTAGP